MKTVGIIAEYNPFHQGHAYQIEQVRKQTDAENIVIVMSGNFVQRGTPAWTDKYLRTQMALAGGASLVIELPAVYATASAEDFALGGVSILHQLGFIDTLCFGSECGELEPLSTIASFLVAPDDDYEEKLRECIRSGMSYPAARDSVLTQKFPSLFQEHPSLLSSPNNILGIEYLKALKRLNSPITPITIARTDGGYHTAEKQNGLLSASGIRKHFSDTAAGENGTAAPRFPLPAKRLEEALSQLENCLPPYIQELLRDNPLRFPITQEDISAMLYYRLRTAADEEILSILDMTPELFHRMQCALPQFSSAAEYIAAVKSKQYTYTRISRSLLHLLLGIKVQYTDSPALYGRLLGFQHSASRLLRDAAALPIITKTADADKLLKTVYTKNQSALAQAHWQIDCLADDIYRQAVFHKSGYALPDIFHAPLITS